MPNHTPHFTSDGVKALILMGGTGERFGSQTPKQFHRLSGKKVYLHTLEVFLKSPLFEKIILVCHPDWIEEVEKDLTFYPNAAVLVVEGGNTRQSSSLKGLLACGDQTQVVVIHDAVRPFVSQEILKQNVLGALKYLAVDTCIPSADTLVYAPQNNQISAIPLRSEYLRGQTPQSFSYPLILQAHLHHQKGEGNSSDDCSLLIGNNYPVHIVEGSEENIKITSELDLFLAEQILRLKQIPSPPQDTSCSLNGKKIAVTGGTGGIGKALCRLLKEEGAIPIALSRSSSDYAVDLTCYDKTQKTFDQILQDLGPLDALINSVGSLQGKPLEQLPKGQIDALIATNLMTAIYSCRCAHLKKGAHIINIASSSYARGRKNLTLYASAKSALVNFTQGLAEEREDLQINALVPQRTHTPMRTHHFPDEDPATLLTPEEVAQKIITLLKQSALTGTVVEVRKK